MLGKYLIAIKVRESSIQRQVLLSCTSLVRMQHITSYICYFKSSWSGEVRGQEQVVQMNHDAFYLFFSKHFLTTVLQCTSQLSGHCQLSRSSKHLLIKASFPQKTLIVFGRLWAGQRIGHNYLFLSLRTSITHLKKAQAHVPSLCRPKQKVVFGRSSIYNVWLSSDRPGSCTAFSQIFYRLMPCFSITRFAFLEFVVNDTRILNLLFKDNCNQDIITLNRQLHRPQRWEGALPVYKHPGDV